jgi:hypothetical protein
MTPEEEVEFWKAYTFYIGQPGIRKGQALMNALALVAPELDSYVSGDIHADCFYRDDKIPAFCEMVGIVEP